MQYVTPCFLLHSKYLLLLLYFYFLCFVFGVEGKEATEFRKDNIPSELLEDTLEVENTNKLFRNYIFYIFYKYNIYYGTHS